MSRAKNGSVPRAFDADFKSSYQKMKDENAALKARVAEMEKVVEAAKNGLLAALDVAVRYDGELKGGAPATLKFIRDGIAAISHLTAPECRDCVDPATGKCLEHPAPEVKP